MVNLLGGLQKFIKEYDLDFLVWLIKQNFDLENVDKILINICW